MDERKIKERIKNARENGKKTQQEIADGIGISRRAYNSLEKGNTRIVNGNILKFAEIVDTSVEELVLGYVPEEDAGRKLLAARTSFEETIRELDERHSKKVNELEETIKMRDKTIEDLKTDIKSKEEIIAFQSKLLNSFSNN